MYNVEINWDEEGQDRSHELPAQVASGEPMSTWQQHQILQILCEFQDMFVDTPRSVKGVEHHIPTPLRKVVFVPLFPTPLALKETLEQEVHSTMV